MNDPKALPITEVSKAIENLLDAAIQQELGTGLRSAIGDDLVDVLVKRGTPLLADWLRSKGMVVT